VQCGQSLLVLPANQGGALKGAALCRGESGRTASADTSLLCVERLVLVIGARPGKATCFYLIVN
jgi:hypothetical protein